MSITLPPPHGWGNDELSNFIETAYQNGFATFDNKKDEYNLLRKIDDCFYKAVTNLINPKHFVVPLLMLRSHSAYRATCSLVINTQVVEGFVLMRACLENAAYALHMYKSDKGLDELWLRRHDDDESQKKVRREFQHKNVIETLTATDKKLSSIYTNLYDRTIDFGAHPNERAITSSLKIYSKENSKVYEQAYLSGNGENLVHGLISLAQVGLCSLCVFENVFSERFSLLGISNELSELKKRL